MIDEQKSMQQKRGMDGHHPLSGPLPCLQAWEQMMDAQAMLPRMGRPNRQKNGQKDRWVDGRTDGGADGRTEGQTDKGTDERTDPLIEVMCSTEQEN